MSEEMSGIIEAKEKMDQTDREFLQILEEHPDKVLAVLSNPTKHGVEMDGHIAELIKTWAREKEIWEG